MIAKKISCFIRYYFAKAEKILLNRPAITGSSAIHQKAKVCSGSQINDTVLGRYSYIGHDCFTCRVQIGAFCSIADNCRIGGHKHAMERVSTSPVFEAGKNCLKMHFASHPRPQVPLTVIGNDVWIGAGVQIQSGITVGSGAVIGMGSIVTHNIPPYEIWAGNPAHFIRKRFDYETILFLQETQFWDWDDRKLAHYGPYMSSPSALRDAIEREPDFI